MHLRAINKTRNRIVAQEVTQARSFVQRFKGLMGAQALPMGCALHILPCNSIHSLFMRFAIDVAFLDKHGEIIHMLHVFPPWRLGPWVRGAHSALELPAGTLEFSEAHIGDCLAFEKS
ncbi:MAG: DUF192 domain-containing protein [Cystobacterineae bacterium]|nr:DUF192 domain-containing protein [Cystobacterineae bacterium]